MQHVLDADVRIPGELPRPVLRSPPPGTFAIYASPRNKAAKEVAELMLAEEVAGRTSGSAAALTITTDPAEAHLAQYFLLYLNDVVHDDAPGLCAELEVALRDKRRVLSVHDQRDGRGAVPFGQIIKRTPPALLSLGVYKEVSEATARTRSNFALVAHACPVGSRPLCHSSPCRFTMVPLISVPASAPCLRSSPMERPPRTRPVGGAASGRPRSEQQRCAANRFLTGRGLSCARRPGEGEAAVSMRRLCWRWAWAILLRAL